MVYVGQKYLVFLLRLQKDQSTFLLYSFKNVNRPGNSDTISFILGASKWFQANF